MRKITVTLKDGTSKEAQVFPLNVLKRNEIFEKYLNLKELMNDKNSDKSIVDMLQDPNKILSFMAECVAESLRGVAVAELTGEECDNVFKNNTEYILAMGGTEIKN